MGMDQYLLIPFLVGWTSINPSYDLGFTRYQGFDPSPNGTWILVENVCSDFGVPRNSDCWWLLSFGPFKGFQHIPSYSQAHMYSFWLLIIYIGISSPISDWGMISVLKILMVEQLGTWLGSQDGWEPLGVQKSTSKVGMWPWLWLPFDFGTQTWLWLAPNPSFIDDFSMKKTCFFAMGFPIATFDDRIEGIYDMVTSQLIIDIHIA